MAYINNLQGFFTANQTIAIVPGGEDLEEEKKTDFLKEIERAKLLKERIGTDKKNLTNALKLKLNLLEMEIIAEEIGGILNADDYNRSIKLINNVRRKISYQLV